ncbi:Putative L,D-transpeptidase YkuD [Polystyrenella longa]|uniref:L,D-transpeptidase YkuD n=1 Tax=Polystyrenella longa TaxID=2528007 RepID=A0A518CT20_9PLAN|nr:L,D-transpeptidase family protein [Polystyrenella longa]QDU82378.1 Putative L,D-transpeptidase YkuD [Polystyrenella longa]
MARRVVRSGHKKNSYFSIVFWSLSLMAVTVYAGWRFGWIPLGEPHQKLTDYLPPKTSNMVAATGKESSNGLTAENLPEAANIPRSTVTNSADSSFSFGNQSEPEVQAAAMTTGARPSSSLMGHSTPRELNLPEINNNAQPVPSQQENSAAIPSRSFSASISSREPIIQAGSEIDNGQRTSAVQVATVPPESRNIRQPAPQSTDVPALNVQEIDQLLEANEYLKAHRMMSSVYWKHPQMRPQLQNRIDTTAKSIYFARQPHYLKPYEVQPGEQLRNIADKYNVSWEYLASLNQLDPQRMRAGQNLKVLKGPFSVIVDLSDFELVVHAYGYYVKKYSVGIGKDGSSPIGTFQVQNKLKDPVYYGPDGLVIQNDDPENPLGEFWIDIGDSYGLHGTIDPESIGKAESKGCIRMLSGDIEEVYNFLVNGSEVTINR